jgi:hypothetical protein
MIGGMPDSASSAEPAPPPGIDITKPNIARVYDYWLDGKDNFAVDRALGDRLLAIDPGMRDLVRGNREFLCAAVARAAHEGGIGQFLDLGAGLPVSPAVHDAARAVIPDARFAYVDNDPVAVLHTQAILGGPQGLVSVSADLADPDAVLGNPVAASVLDLDKPMGIIFGSVGHFFEASRMRSLAGAYLSRARPGSWLIISLGRAEDTEPEQRLQPAYTAARTYRYSLEEFESLFTGTEILPPGLREARTWVSGTVGPVPSAGLFMHCGVGVKR